MRKPISHSRPGNTSAAVSVIGGGTTILGNVSSTADLHIDGRVEGNIACSAMVQGEDSEIVGGVKAETVRIAGRVDGSIAAREVVVLKSAHIVGDVAYDSLTIEHGAKMDGRLSPRNGQQHAGQPASAPAMTRSSEGNEARLVLAASDRG